MIETRRPMAVFKDWRTILGDQPSLGAEVPGRELWPVTATCGECYFLKRLSPWRNLPVADEARVLRRLSAQGIGVAEFLITEHATVVAGEADDTFVLMPRLERDEVDPADLVALEESVGAAVAELHLALARYPWSANSYVERLVESLRGDLMLPADLTEGLIDRRDGIAATLTALPDQLVHGDLTPENVLLRKPGVVSGFIDFDHLPLAPRVWDVGKYLSRRMRLRWWGTRVPTSSRLDHIHRFLRGYQQVSPLTGAEVEAIPGAIAVGNLAEASYFQRIASGLLDRRKLSDHDEVLDDTVDAARWHLDNYESVVAAVHDAVRSQ